MFPVDRSVRKTRSQTTAWRLQMHISQSQPSRRLSNRQPKSELDHACLLSWSLSQIYRSLRQLWQGWLQSITVLEVLAKWGSHRLPYEEEREIAHISLLY